MNCTKKVVVYLGDDRISTKGIEVWGQDLKFVDFACFIDDIDCYVFLKDDEPIRHGILGTHVIDNKGDSVIVVHVNNDVVIAHEWGHHLGLKDNTVFRSIMNPSFFVTNMPLDWFIEFSNN